MNIVKPKKLQKGDTIGIIAPCGVFSDPERLEKGIEFLESAGFKIKVSDKLFARERYMAGNNDVRAGEIEKGIQTQRKSELDEEFEMARQLYGDELLKELTEPKEKTNKVATYNAIMKSLPTRIPKKHKTPIRGFNLQ